MMRGFEKKEMQYLFTSGKVLDKLIGFQRIPCDVYVFFCVPIEI